MLTGIAQKNTHLTIGPFAQLTTPLPFDAHTLLALLGHTAVIADQHPLGLTQIITDFLSMLPQDRLICSPAFAHKVLQVTDLVGVISF
jgi:hypothetical protein